MNHAEEELKQIAQDIVDGKIFTSNTLINNGDGNLGIFPLFEVSLYFYKKEEAHK